MFSKKGFTLFEILIVITIMAIISIAALTSTVTVQKQFVFINTFKSLLNKVREARVDAVTQKAVNLDGHGTMGIPSSYGVYINQVDGKINVRIFGDLTTGNDANAYDANDSTISAVYTLDPGKYSLDIIADESDPNGVNNYSIIDNNSLTILYPPTELKVIPSGVKANNLVSFPTQFVQIKLTDLSNPQLSKTISVFLRSGIAEEKTS